MIIDVPEEHLGRQAIPGRRHDRVLRVHLVLVIVSLTLGTIIGILGVRALRARPEATGAVEADRSVTGSRQ